MKMRRISFASADQAAAGISKSVVCRHRRGAEEVGRAGNPKHAPREPERVVIMETASFSLVVLVCGMKCVQASTPLSHIRGMAHGKATRMATAALTVERRP
jgi:hypothetical protein